MITIKLWCPVHGFQPAKTDLVNFCPKCDKMLIPTEVVEIIPPWGETTHYKVVTKPGD